jgi:hypothetical protein
MNQDSDNNTTNTTNGTGGDNAVRACAPVAFPPRTAVAAALRVRALPPPECAQPRAFGPPACTGICQGIVSGGACLCPPRRFGDDCSRTADPDKARSTTGLVSGGMAAVVEGGGGDGVEIPAGGLVGDFLVSVEVFPVMPEPGPQQVTVQILGNGMGLGLLVHNSPPNVGECNVLAGQ